MVGFWEKRGRDVAFVRAQGSYKTHQRRSLSLPLFATLWLLQTHMLSLTNNQCDLMPSWFVRYLAIYNNVNWPNGV